MIHLKKSLITLFISFFFCIASFAQALTITGTVTDEIGESVIGCSVALKGKAVGDVTDVDGRFTLQAEPGDVMVFSYIGYIKQEIRIEADKLHYNVALKLDDAQLMETVVVGYGVTIQPSKSGIATVSKSVYDLLSEEEYTSFGENKFKSPSKEPFSTFSVDVDAASYTNIRRFLNDGLFPPRDAIRTEELINFFKYDYQEPADKEPIAISTETGICPWNHSHLLFKAGIKSREIMQKNLPATNFVFLIDVSGSMFGPTRLDLVKSSLKMLVENLRSADKVAIVVYAGSAGMVLPSTSGKSKNKIITALDNLEAGGSTAGGEGILLAYKIAKDNFIKDGNNRIILCTDGDFNVGPSSGKQLEALIEEQRKSGVFLSVLGYGMGNYKDNRMQVLAQKGNGNHAYIDDIAEAKRVLVNETGTLYTVAKDAKLQIEFNPAKVQSYRLIGYETRLMDDQDFNDDTKDAGEMGAGHTVTAFYEIIPAHSDAGFGIIEPGEKETSEGSTSPDELLTIKLRYKLPDKDESRLLSVPVIYDVNQHNGDDFRFASAVAMFAQLLRDSEFKGNATYDDVIKLAESAVGKDKDGLRREFVQLAEKAKEMVHSGKPLLYGNIHMDNDLFEEFETDTTGETFYGIKDKKENIIIQPVYDYIEYISGGIFIVEKDDRYGLYHYYSGEITSLIYDDIERVNDLAFIVEKDGFKGLVNFYGKEIVPPVYDSIEDNTYGLFLLEKNDMKGVVDYKGKQIVQLEYEYVDINYDYIIVEKDDKKSAFNKNGKLIIPAGYNEIDYYYDILVVKSNNYGVYNAEGIKKIPVKYHDISSMGNWLKLEKNLKYGIATNKGIIIIKAAYDDIEEMSSRFFQVERKGKYGLVDTKGDKLVPVRYDMIEELKGDLFLLKKVEKDNDIYGVYNASLKKKILSEKYYDVEYVENSEIFTNEDGTFGLLIVEQENNNKEDKCGLFTAGGKAILPVTYDYITEVELEDDDYNLKDLFFCVEQNDKYGLTDKTGKIILPVIYDDMKSFFHKGIIEAKLNGNKVYFDKNGNSCQFDEK